MPKIVEKCSDPRTLSQIVASGVLRCGPMPKHVAFIMDGNRRYARKQGQPVMKGHEEGRRVLEDLIFWAHALKIPMITAYAFSIENFKRTEEEVENLIELFVKMLAYINASEANGLGEFGIRLQIIGNWEMIPHRLQPHVAKINLNARAHPESRLLVNIALAYTSRDAMLRSHLAILEGHEYLTPSDVTEGLFQELHSILPILPVDLFIRTGGDTRLSDFMSWESAYAHVEFLEVTWPEFTFWEFWKTIFRFQATPRIKDPRREETLTKKQLEYMLEHRDKMWKEMELAAERYNNELDEEIMEIKVNWMKSIFAFLVDG